MCVYPHRAPRPATRDVKVLTGLQIEAETSWNALGKLSDLHFCKETKKCHCSTRGDARMKESEITPVCLSAQVLPMIRGQGNFDRNRCNVVFDLRSTTRDYDGRALRAPLRD